MKSEKPLMLDIDLGNSSAKWCLRVGSNKHYGSATGQQPLLQALSVFFAEKGFLLSSVESLHIASVCSDARNQEIQQSLVAQKIVKPCWLDSEQKTAGVTNSYTEPQRMGVDRWAAIVAAVEQLRSEQRSLCSCIVDAGSALTLDLSTLMQIIAVVISCRATPCSATHYLIIRPM